jgi:hypothetical protein
MQSLAGVLPDSFFVAKPPNPDDKNLSQHAEFCE